MFIRAEKDGKVRFFTEIHWSKLSNHKDGWVEIEKTDVPFVKPTNVESQVKAEANPLEDFQEKYVPKEIISKFETVTSTQEELKENPNGKKRGRKRKID